MTLYHDEVVIPRLPAFVITDVSKELRTSEQRLFVREWILVLTSSTLDRVHSELR